MAEFNPDKFLERTGNKTNGFDPDAFLKRTDLYNGPSLATSAIRQGAQGITGGLSDELSGGIEAVGRVVGLKGLGGPIKDISLHEDGPTLSGDDISAAYERGRNLEREGLKRDMESNPITSVGSQVVGGIVSPINKITKGMGALKTGATLSGVYGFGTSEADNIIDTAIDTGKGAAIGLGTGYVGQKVANAIAPTAEKVASKISQAIPKKNQENIIAAADRVGLKLTPAMLDDTGFVERLEYTLSNSPSFLGQRVNRAQKQAYESLQSAVKEATKDATNLTEFQVGERVKSGITSKVGERLDPISSVFNEVKESTKFIPISQKSKDAIIRNIQNTDEYVLTGGAGKANQYVEMLNRAQNADQVKTMMTMLNSDIQAAQGAERQVLMTIRSKLGNLENNSITRAAIAQAKDAGLNKLTGKKIGSEIVSDLKEARQGYRKLMTDLGETAQDARLGKTYGPSGFLDKVESIPSERLQQRLFNTDNQRQLQNLAKNFPDEFALLRQGKLRDIADSAIGEQGQTSVKKFLSQVEKLSPEAQEIVFANNGQLLDDLFTLNNALPRNFNPSGSGTQAGWQEAIYSNVKDIPNYLLYKGASTNLGKAIGRSLDDSAINTVRDVTARGVRKIQNPAVRGAAELFSTKDLRGYDRWEQNGADLLKEQGVDQAVIDKLKETKKGKQLLIEASDAKPNSKRMQSVLDKVRTGFMDGGE